ncbi:MAG: hypothetical protein HON65_01350 [Rhodospirillales bacterium]|nr:hypothetical protein [Rhodospirillales bacterium]
MRAATTARSGSLHGPVESITASSPADLSEDSFTNVASFGDHELPEQSAYSYDRRDRSNQRRGSGQSGQQDIPTANVGMISSTTENFAKMLELRDVPLMNSQPASGEASDRATLNIITRAVTLYETSVNILTNPQNVRGETLSFSL